MQQPHSPGSDSRAMSQGGTDHLPAAGHAQFDHAAGSGMSMKWAALHEAAAVVCSLAGLQAEIRKSEIRNFPAMMRDTGGWRLDLACQGVDDLAAFMEPGLVALVAVSARGLSPAPAALALWHEFVAARAALLALVPPPGIKRRT
ncbi:hypothetical protein Saro_0243 [Novosphingobium aromaticivorans DSM 12444]|uniref:Uncharacterized protein n=2 Tax=Novosphingobium aromaticivorans TaxID=48935 RepID=Q2GBT2_NOVAD|nr:hypothetical protein Saro_0243 [Novosphingobium aromaticivorans DSM 12444]